MTVTKEHLEVIQNRISTLEHYVSMIVEEIKAINGRAAAAATSSSGPKQQVATRPLTDQEKEEMRQHQQRQMVSNGQVTNGSDDDLWPIRKLPPMSIEQYQELLETEMYPGLALVVQND